MVDKCPPPVNVIRNISGPLQAAAGRQDQRITPAFLFAALLWGRHSLGWRGQRAVRMVYAGAGLLLLSYVGYHFVLEVILRRG